MCIRREFPLTVIDCTGITKVNDLISSPLSVQEATCLIYNCRRVSIDKSLASQPNNLRRFLTNFARIPPVSKFPMSSLSLIMDQRVMRLVHHLRRHLATSTQTLSHQ